jgi:hypothetical protein
LLQLIHDPEVECRVTVGLGWTRARASNPRFGQGWAHTFCSRGLDGFGFLSDELDRVHPFCSEGLNGFGFLFDGLNRTRIFVRSDVQLEIVVWVEIRVECPTHGLGGRFGVSGWVRTCRLVRRVGLGGQVMSEPEPWASSGALALEPNPTATLVEWKTINETWLVEQEQKDRKIERESHVLKNQ